ncbi:alpha/beta fold hydrolase [Mangrovibacterium diazotrophicum]|uniref:Pimeloyl-ACP methyl ester carboxylesterase n=1 Tax=Mangrovibacterium diazotrophicum TaxID=1261403 RepID=A0A419W525_9BACT|nr:alpha/beta fold hydrolase [Mangrovibacterium diazotrophicum]RKD90562.1 pimeloyl-ACP methyl ester carboxylesterase [Mangrovibacterium diazotrophicum]
MDLFFREEGSQGKNIVIVHGLYGSSDNWLTVGKKLGKNHHVYLIDQRNHGRSPNAEEHTYELMKEDLAEFFEKHNIDKAILIGHSMGGKTAMFFAAEYPEKVEKLIVADIAPKDYLELGENSQYYQHQLILQTLIELQNNCEAYHSREEISNFLMLKLGSQDLVMFLLKSIYLDKETQQFHCRVNVEVLNDSLDEIISGMNYRWIDDRIPIVAYPVLFIRGAKSNYLTEEDVKMVKEIYPEAVIETIPDAGHWLHAEQPKLFMEALLRFI